MIAVAILDAIVLGGVIVAAHSMRSGLQARRAKRKRFSAGLAAILLVGANIAILYIAAMYFPIAALILAAVLIVAGAIVAR